MVQRTCGRARVRAGRARPPLRTVAVAALLALAPAARASDDTRADTAPDATATTPLPGVVVHADGNDAIESPAFPASTATVDADEIDATVNAIDVEDAIKYLPSLFVRKRNYGDTQPVLATRTWGVGSSARTLVYVDDVLISALVANNNTLGAPRWGMAAPAEVDHVTMLYGPFSAAYAGNSIGGVLHIVTRTPERTEFTFEQSGALQSFDRYRTSGDHPTSQASATAGGRAGAASWFVGANVQDSFSQPIAFITGAMPPPGTTGAIDATNKLGQAADVFGAGGLLHTRMHALNGRVSWDFTPWLRATWLAGWWNNDADSRVETYLRDAVGRATFGHVAGFANNHYTVDQAHLMQALSLRTDTHGRWDGEAVITHYDYLHDRQLSPAGVGDGTTFTPNGRRADLGGTNWSTLDLQGTWRPAAHEVAFGAHVDEYTLDNATRNTTAWRDAGSATTLFTAGAGTTRTSALWLQDAWSLAPAWFATFGVRAERWRARDGFNVSGGTTIVQPNRSDSAWSPKATLSWTPSADWRVSGSLGRAVRFPTVSELYQIVSTGSTFVSPNPDLRPERALSGELALERTGERGTLRISVFEEAMRDALISQTSTIEGVAAPVSFVDNVGRLRNRGVELVAQCKDAGLHGLDLAASLTFVDSTILENDGFVGQGGSTSIGKHAPNVPRWRASAVATWHPGDAWTFTLAGRYSGKQYSTLDNTDTTPHVYGAFDRFVVFDARVRWKASEHVSAALGVDNLADRDYVLFHPFPRRTIVASVDVRY